MRSVAKTPMPWLLLFLAAAFVQETGAAEAEAFALEKFSPCGEATLADVDSAVSDIAYLPAHNILLTASAERGDILAHSLGGTRQSQMDVSLGGTEANVGVAAWGNAVAAIDAKGTIRQSGLARGEEAISITELIQESHEDAIKVFNGIAYREECECFYTIGTTATNKGVFEVSAATGAITELSPSHSNATMPGMPASLHAFSAATGESGLLVLDSENGVIYKVGTPDELREGAAPEPVVRLADLMGGNESGGLGFEPAGITMNPDGSLLVVAARDGRVFHFCADSNGRPAAEEPVTLATERPLDDTRADVKEAPGAAAATEVDTTLTLLLSISGGGSNKLVPPKISLVAGSQHLQGLSFPDKPFLASVLPVEENKELLLQSSSPGTTKTDQQVRETPKRGEEEEPSDLPGFPGIPSSLLNRDPMLVADRKFDLKQPMIDSIPELP